eukprot:TRINITY_DN12217_c0_g1_i1.p1 TRINITY_DN12217_c0_g1~~TRINITY_DN12217_c0_g1_i1.p1  ORF type:complete len:608 (-),score=110.53 TRINITY_DN12217_c0_g1_i1:469-2292(-)
MEIKRVATLVLWSAFFTSLIEGKILRKKAKYQGDYEDYDDYDAANENYDATKEVELTSIPEFISTAESMMIDEGDTIKLDCIVDKLDNLIIMWKKGNKIIAINDKLFEKDEDDRTKVEKVPNGNRLTIRLAEEDDAGEYLCQVTAAETIELVHDVQIRVKPRIESIPESGLVKVTAGEPVELSCKVTQGYPTPEVLWRRKERPMPTGEDFISGLSIYYPTTNRHHSGIYTCSADNGASEVATAEIKLTVHHPPEIEQNKLLIQNKDENEVKIICTVHASPAAKVDWFKDGEFLEPKNNVITKRGNRHTLLLPGIVKGDQIGSYECRAKNALGEATASTEVSINAKPAQFTSAADGTDMTKYVLEWIVISTTEVSECNIRFKIDDDSKDWMFITANVKKVEPDAFVGKVTLEHLHPGKRYVVQVASKNADDYNDFSESFTFATKENPEKENFEEDLLSETNNFVSETDYMQEYETDVEPAEGSGIDFAIPYEGSGIEEDIVLPNEADNIFPKKMEIEEDVFLPVAPSEKMDIEEDIVPAIEGSGEDGSGVVPKRPMLAVSTEQSADAVDMNSENTELPKQEKSTSGSRPLTFHSILELSVFCIFILAN